MLVADWRINCRDELHQGVQMGLGGRMSHTRDCCKAPRRLQPNVLDWILPAEIEKRVCSPQSTTRTS